MSSEHERKIGFPPVYNEQSKVLILGSFPSVKSREIQFYYGHKQNRFWKTVCGIFGESVPDTIDKKKEFLLRRKIALWDIAESCEIVGSSDASLKNAKIVDLAEIIKNAPIEKILLNGSTAFALFISKYENVGIPYRKMLSTSPANPRFSTESWEKELAYLR